MNEIAERPMLFSVPTLSAGSNRSQETLSNLYFSDLTHSFAGGARVHVTNYRPTDQPNVGLSSSVAIFGIAMGINKLTGEPVHFRATEFTHVSLLGARWIVAIGDRHSSY